MVLSDSSDEEEVKVTKKVAKTTAKEADAKTEVRHFYF